MTASRGSGSSYDSDNRNTQTRRIGIVTPAPPGSRRGNRVTAERWSAILGRLGHTVEIVERYTGQAVDVLIVLHAGRSAESVRQFREHYPARPLLLAVTGTDVYSDEFDPAEVQHSLAVADRLIVFQPRTVEDLGPGLRPKARVIFHSVEPLARRDPPRADVFEVAVVGHLRSVKDPFRAVEAARRLPAASRVRILHLGEAMSPAMAERAGREQRENPRYEWLGDLAHDAALAVLARCRLMAITSLSEGGPTVIAESVVAGVPVLATRVSGCVGMLGDDYPGLFPVGDTQALAGLLRRAETDSAFYESLRTACDRLRPLFEPAAELAAWRKVLAEISVPSVNTEPEA